MALSASAHMRHFGSKEYRLAIDLKPALDEKTLDGRLQRELVSNRQLKNMLPALLPQSVAAWFVRLIPFSEKACNSVTREERKKLLEMLKRIEFSAVLKPIEEAIVTSGGVETREINPKTMQSKLLPNLYFAGEVIDVDALTGGFNIQIALSTGYCAGKHASESK